jgi:integrase
MTRRKLPHLEGESVKIFREAMRAEETWLQYERRFWHFLDWLGETPDSFLERSKADKNWTTVKVIDYIILQKQRVKKGEISESSVANFKKPVKLFLDMNDVSLNWKKINKTLPSMRRYALDRAPTIEEIRKLLQYPDMRVGAIVLVMSSSGIRVGAWDYLKIRNLHPIQRDGQIVACKLVVYENEPDEYITFITPEAYKVIQDYIQFRKLYGEKFGPSSPLLRDLFCTTGNPQNWQGIADNPVILKHNGVKHLVERAMWRTGLRHEKKKRHEFAIDHGFRKYFKTRAEQVMKPINVEWLMGHSTGISDSYYRPTEQDILNDYLKAVPLLTISEVAEVRRENEKVKTDFEERLHRIEALVTSLVSQKELQALALDAHHKPDTVQ